MAMITGALTVLLMACFATTSTAQVAAAEASCANPCFIVGDYYPIASCQPSCDPTICNRGYDVFTTDAECCAPEAAFPDGCTQRLEECWVVESYNTRTCIRDDRKCLQGSGVYGSQEACCAVDAAFPEGCADVTPSEVPCYVPEYFPTKLCRASRTLCGPDSGVQSFSSMEACCAAGAAFPRGCAASGPPNPCFVVDSYYPERRCRMDTDVAVCSRGWGVFGSQASCCAKRAAFTQGCSVTITASAAVEPTSETVAKPATTAAN